MKNNNIIFRKRQSLSLCLILVLFSFTMLIISSCSKEDDIPPPSAYVPPPPDTTGGCTFLFVMPELSGDQAIDFECEGPAEYTIFGEKDGAITVDYVENPSTSGINDSDLVVQVTQTPGLEPWAGFFFDLSAKIDFSTFQAVRIKVYSPAAGQSVNLKLEDSADGAINSEVSTLTTVANEWEELCFPFSSGDTDKFDRFVLFFDFQGPKAEETIHYFDDIRLGEDCPEVEEPEEPTTAAPDPILPESEVIAIYSDAYTPITLSEFPTEWSSSDFEEIQIEGNNTIKYANLDFTGIVTDYANPTDLTTMSYVHFDYWTPDGEELGIKLVNTVLDPVQEDTESVGTVVQGEWVSVDIPLDDFEIDRSQVTQIILDNLSAGNITVYIDNIYFHMGQPNMPLFAAPMPIHDAADVISIYSDVYTPTTVTEFPTEWSGSGFEEIQIEGDNTVKYFDLDFTGIVTDYGNPPDLTGMTHVHFDYWTPDGEELGIKLVNTTLDPAQEDLESVGTVLKGQWVSVDIPLDDFDFDRSGVTQILFDNLVEGDASITVYMDNLYFYMGGGMAMEPTTPAPDPTQDAADVISIYSDAYTPTTVTELPTEWSGSGFEEIQIEGNNTIKYFDLDFTGIVTDYGNPTDLTEMTHVHFDYWTADGVELGLKLVNTTVDPVEDPQVSVGAVLQGEWVSVDISLDDFAFDRSKLTQILFDNEVEGDASITVFIDNLYFYKEQATMPLVAAPTPTRDAADVISIYSDAYTPTTVTELPTEWSGSGFEEIQIEGNNTIKYFDLDFTGIVTDYGNPTDLTEMTHVHFDYWTADGVELGLKLVNTTVDPVEDPQVSVGTVLQGEWVSVDISLDDFAFDRSKLTQILFDNEVEGDASITVFIDNLYFYK